MLSASKLGAARESLAQRWVFVRGASIRRVRPASRLLIALIAIVPGLGCGGGTESGGADPEFEPAVVADSALRTGADELRMVRLSDERGTVHEGWLRHVTADAVGVSDTTGAVERLSVLLLGGIGTHKRAAEILPCPPGVTLFALDYPYRGDRRPSHWNLLKSLPAIREASTATPRGLRAAIRYLATRPEADPRGVLVIGASFGGSYVLKAIDELPRERDAEGDDLGPRDVRAVAILYWGAGQPDMARYRMRERPAWERETIALALQLFFDDLEPRKTVGSVSPRPLLLVNGEHDELVSPAAAESLRAAAAEPVRQIWLPTQHMQPDAEELLLNLVRITMEWQAALGD